MEILLYLSIYVSGALAVLWLITIAFDLFLK
ncbi:hypothetical protein QFZ73_005243 [Peribacillus sp. V2I11]|nr:hypothetical protein [Peribacillus sp. V2I11]